MVVSKIHLGLPLENITFWKHNKQAVIIFFGLERAGIFCVLDAGNILLFAKNEDSHLIFFYLLFLISFPT